MKFVALISGGKDSTFNILECLCQGHNLVALVNLYPPKNSNKDELDSYMYQSVGFEAIDFIAKAIDCPLYRKEINGKSIATEISYDKTEGDEIEDLYEILNDVKKIYPDCEGVSTGAILSDYQRIRVENVCSRLGLISLGYMWRQDQSKLLNDMVNCQMNPILIKVSAYGLNEQHIGQNIPNIYQNLIEYKNKYGLNPCGEGGEYETFTLDAPYFTKSLNILDKKLIITDKDKYSPVIYLKILDVELEDKQSISFSHHKTFYESDVCKNLPILRNTNVNNLKNDLMNEIKSTNSRNKCLTDKMLCMKNMYKVVQFKQFVGDNLEENCENLFIEVLKFFHVTGYSIEENVVYCIFCIPDMSKFSSINKVYCKYIPSTNPPPRTCIELNKAELSISLMLDIRENPTSFRRIMHIQSLSHWAPASIGPYSQAVLINSETNGPANLLLSGQIGLHPENSELVNQTDIAQQLLMCLRHVTRVAKAHHEITWSLLDTMLCYCSGSQSDIRLCADSIHEIVCESIVLCICKRIDFIIVSNLPKNALVELQCIFTACVITSLYDDDEDEDNLKDSDLSLPKIKQIQYDNATIFNGFNLFKNNFLTI